MRISRATAPVPARSMRMPSYQALPQVPSVSFTRLDQVELRRERLGADRQDSPCRIRGRGGPPL